MKPTIRKPLRKGALVYHGTDAEDDFDLLEGPSWVTNNLKTATSFVTWGKRGGLRRVLTFRVTQPPRLAIARTKDDFRSFVEWVVAETGLDEPTTGYELAEMICDSPLGIDGWHIPNQYGPDASDTLICTPDQFLELVAIDEIDESMYKERLGLGT